MEDISKILIDVEIMVEQYLKAFYPYKRQFCFFYSTVIFLKLNVNFLDPIVAL